MKRLFGYGALVSVGLCLFLPCAALSGGYSDFYNAFNEEKAVVTKNGTDMDGQVFTKTYDPEPEELLVLAGDTAFVLKTTGLFMQRLGMSNVYDLTINNIDDKSRPAMIEYDVGPGIAGAVLEETGDGGYAFTARGDRYEVRLKRPIKRDPDMFVSQRGYLVSRTERIGTKSEGPEYYLRLEDGREIHVIKNADLWKEDPRLQEKVGVEVWVLGTLVDGEMIYKEVNPNLR